MSKASLNIHQTEGPRYQPLLEPGEGSLQQDTAAAASTPLPPEELITLNQASASYTERYNLPIGHPTFNIFSNCTKQRPTKNGFQVNCMTFFFHNLARAFTRRDKIGKLPIAVIHTVLTVLCPILAVIDFRSEQQVTWIIANLYKMLLSGENYPVDPTCEMSLACFARPATLNATQECFDDCVYMGVLSPLTLMTFALCLLPPAFSALSYCSTPPPFNHFQKGLIAHLKQSTAVSEDKIRQFVGDLQEPGKCQKTGAPFRSYFYNPSDNPERLQFQLDP